MDKSTFDYVAERVEILMSSDASKQETKDAARIWKSTVADASDAEVEAATLKLVDFLEGRPNRIDDVIAFAQGPAVEMFGKEAADQMLARQLAHKQAGGEWCACDACTAASELLSKFGRV